MTILPKEKCIHTLVKKVNQRVFITRVSRFFPLVGLSFHQLGMTYYMDVHVSFFVSSTTLWVTNTLTKFLTRVSIFFPFGRIVIPPTRNDILPGLLCSFFFYFQVPPHYIRVINTPWLIFNRVSILFSFGRIVIPPTRNDILQGLLCSFFYFQVPPHYIWVINTLWLTFYGEYLDFFIW